MLRVTHDSYHLIVTNMLVTYSELLIGGYNMLPNDLQRRLGAQANIDREEQLARKLPECPPVDPNLVAHLNAVFTYPVRVKPFHPQLAQLLTVQYGVEKVIDYLKEAYKVQSELARKANAR